MIRQQHGNLHPLWMDAQPAGNDRESYRDRYQLGAGPVAAPASGRIDGADAEAGWSQALQAAADVLAGVLLRPWHAALLTALVVGAPVRRTDLCVAAMGLATGVLPEYELRLALDELVDCGLAARYHITLGADEAYEITAMGEQHIRTVGDAVAVLSALAADAQTVAAWRRLSPRDRHVARLVAYGCTDRDVSAAIRANPITVCRAVRRLQTMLGLRSRSQLIAFVTVAAPCD